MKKVCAVLCLAVQCTIAAEPQSLSSILARMDLEAPKFHGMSADVAMLTYTAILGDTTREKGTLQMQKLGGSDVRAIVDFSQQSDARTIGFLGKYVRIYYPKLKQYQDVDVGKNTDVLNQFLLLGFGSSGRDLSKSYKITLGGQENVAGQETSRLELIPKDKAVLERLTKVDVWIPSDASYPVQQQFFEPSGNYRRVTYTNIKVNPPMSGTLDLKLPPGVQKQR